MMDLAKMTIDDLNCAIQDCLDTIPNIAGMELSGMRVLKSSQQHQDEALGYQREIDRRRKPERRSEMVGIKCKSITPGSVLPPLSNILSSLNRAIHQETKLREHGHLWEESDLLALTARDRVLTAEAQLDEACRRIGRGQTYRLLEKAF